jgi:UDP-GlcNAc:undecaprenyl-phosphate GlcNAc-1-phosphate transferase
VPLAGALLGFLRYNFNPASIFLGDCGSLTLGFLLGCYGVKWSEKSTTLLSMAAPVLALSVPLLDVVLAIGRRFLRNQPLFTADLSHIHHKLLSRGFSTRQVALILYASCGIAAIASVVLVCVPKQFHMAIILAVFCLALVSLRWLGYQEFGLAGKMAIDGSFQRLLNAQLTLKSFEQDLAKTASVQECWNILRVGCSQFGFTGLRLNVDGTIRETGHTKGWCVRIELPTFGYINLVRGMDVVGPGELSSSFADCVSRILVSKLEELRESEVQTTGKFIPVSSYPVRGEQKIVRSGEGD